MDGRNRVDGFSPPEALCQNAAMTYPPPYYLESDENLLFELMDAAPLAQLISHDDRGLHATPVPLMRHAGPLRLIGHLDANNPQVDGLDGASVLVVFSGPDRYISPNDYHTRQLPTWNYLQVHVRGQARLLPQAAAKRAVLDDTAVVMEQDQTTPFHPDQRQRTVTALLPKIAAVEIRIDEMTGRVKLSKDKTSRDQRAAADKLLDGDAGPWALLVERFLNAGTTR